MMHTFSSLAEGQRMGEIQLEIFPSDLAVWKRIAGGEANATGFHAPGLIAALMMRGYMQLMPERPEGNIHAQQAWRWTHPVPRALTRLDFEITCHGKHLHKGKRWVHLVSQLSTSTLIYVQAETCMVWAA